MANQVTAAATGYDEHGILVILREVLAPLGTDRVEQIIGWVGNEIRTRPLIAYCWDGHHDAAWEITKDSPISEGRKVFAMLHWEAQRAVVAYCFKEVEVGGQKGVQFFREVIMDPKHITGPVSHTALFDDLRAFLVEESAIEVERFLGHLKTKLDPKTFERVVAASDDFPAFVGRGEDEEAEAEQPTTNGGA
jgi:hypothetical protein